MKIFFFFLVESTPLFQWRTITETPLSLCPKESATGTNSWYYDALFVDVQYSVFYVALKFYRAGLNGYAKNVLMSIKRTPGISVHLLFL
jgi:hypothetical protein